MVPCSCASPNSFCAKKNESMKLLKEELDEWNDEKER